MRLWVRLAALMLALLLPSVSRAHEVRPALLQITEDGPAHYQVLWKQPTMGDVAIRLQPHLSGGALEVPAGDQFAAPGFLVKTWSVDAKVPLDGQTVAIEGLEQTTCWCGSRPRTAAGSTRSSSRSIQA
jgi:hypothetical protein